MKYIASDQRRYFDSAQLPKLGSVRIDWISIKLPEIANKATHKLINDFTNRKMKFLDPKKKSKRAAKQGVNVIAVAGLIEAVQAKEKQQKACPLAEICVKIA
ncbi:MAG: hypothetical protein ACREBR_02710 [bacterium]